MLKISKKTLFFYTQKKQKTLQCMLNKNKIFIQHTHQHKMCLKTFDCFEYNGLNSTNISLIQFPGYYLLLYIYYLSTPACCISCIVFAGFWFLIPLCLVIDSLDLVLYPIRVMVDLYYGQTLCKDNFNNDSGYKTACCV